MHHRTAERDKLRHLFTQGSSAQMLAPRRLGKTWLMRAAAADLRDAGWLAVIVDVEGMRSEEEFLKALCQEIEKADQLTNRVMNHLAQRLKQAIGGGWDDKPIQAIGRIDHKAFAEALIASLDAHQQDAVIFVDEIALFVIELLARDAGETSSFLYLLRRLRQNYPRVRWLFTGSIGLDVVARRATLQGALVDLDIFPLEPFDMVAARSYLEEQCKTGQVFRPCSFDDESFAYLAQAIGWLSPYYLKLVVDRIQPGGPPGPNGHRLARIEDIERAIETLLEPNHRGSFATWEEHIDKNFPSEVSDRLHDILNVCCEAENGETFATVQTRLAREDPNLTVRGLKDLLTALANAGYLTEDNGRWRFLFGLLRRYWLKYLHE